jgi:predicted aspartyl protease
MVYPYIDGDPVVNLKVQAKGGIWYDVLAYVDSGAGYSVFHADYAKALGMDLKSGKKINLVVGDGSKIEAFVHKIPVRFAGREFTAEISFSPSLGIGTNILGMRSFFDRFRICFDNKRQRVEVAPS